MFGAEHFSAYRTPLPKRYILDGIRHEFPDDFTNAQIAQALKSYRPSSNDVPALKL
jgi:hypothetical protein